MNNIISMKDFFQVSCGQCETKDHRDSEQWWHDEFGCERVCDQCYTDHFYPEDCDE